METSVLVGKDDRVEVRDDGSKLITPAFAKDAPAPAEKREGTIASNISRHDELQNILARLQKNQEAQKQKATEEKVQQEAKVETTKQDAHLAKALEEKKKFIKEKQALNLKAKEYEEALNKLKDLESAKANPLEWLKKSGYTYEQLVNHMVNNPDTLSESDKKLFALEQEIKSLKTQQEEKERAEAAKRQQEQFDDFFKSVKQTVDDDAKKVDYELIRVTESYQPLIDRMANVWRETGEIPDIAESAAAHEDEILNYALEVVKKSPKLQSKIMAVLNLGKDEQKVTSQPKAKPTLTNAQTAMPQTTEVPIKTIIHGNKPSNFVSLQEVEQIMKQKGQWPFGG